MHEIYCGCEPQITFLVKLWKLEELWGEPTWNVPYHHLCPGDCHSQAWTLRRCLTIFNSILRRPYWPREPQIQDLISKLGLKLPPKQVQDCDEDEDFNEEEIESEEETDDEEVEICVPHDTASS